MDSLLFRQVDTSLGDADFPDRSRKAARNYCRNPNRKYAMPWCYTLDPNVIDDVCDIPLCSYPGNLVFSFSIFQ